MKVLTPILSLLILFSSCSQNNLTIENGNLVYELNGLMHTKITYKKEGVSAYMNGFQASDYIVINNQKIDQFDITEASDQEIEDEKLGKGIQWVIKGSHKEGSIHVEKTSILKKYDNYPDLLLIKTTYTNLAEKAVITKVASNQYEILHTNDTPSYWAFQGSSTSARSDWIRPLVPGYYDKNYMGMNNSDYGGGIPVVDIWRRDAGLAIGHVELTPKLVSIPTEIKLNETNVTISVENEFAYPTLFEKDQTVETLETFVLTHTGDYYNALTPYSKFMQAKGIEMVPTEDAAYEPIWCAWGYERDFTLDEVLGTLPKVKELGIKWAVLDDGFQIAEGDWNANPKKFPRGDIEIKELVDEIHNNGLKAKIWWTPLAADPESKAMQENPDMRLFTEEWAPQFITWWDAYYLAPINQKTQKHTEDIINLFINVWGFDGLKMDGQHMNAVPPDHNPASKLDYAEQAVEKLPEFFQMIYDKTRALKPNAVVENCPCGTCMSFYNMTSMNQAVSSDPLSSWQIRHKGKTYKALIPHTAYYGDHVELSDNASDFASSFGIGAVLGTKFTWPKNNPTGGDFLLTPEKEIIWKKWFKLYNEMMLSKETYLGNLYDIGYDKPETHVIQKGNTLYYAFYADNWEGKITFKGLGENKYSIRDYVNNVELGTIENTNPLLDVSFEGFLLVEATPL